jgi:hypothetical protein
MKEKINEQLICVLVHSPTTNEIEIQYEPIINPLESDINNFVALCSRKETSLDDIISHIQTQPNLDQLSAYYKYCESLRAAYQGFTADNQGTIQKINSRKELIDFNYKLDPEKYNREEKIEEFKHELRSTYNLWGKAFAINLAYRKCYENKNVLTFSHRICGWSNPVYNLTPNFSVEIKTNFGYGSASYFYTKLKYKNIDITPFSEWITYEYAQFYEIIRYTQSHILDNQYWLEAMTFCKDACNLSVKDEEAFVSKYVVDECEEMVKGLEELFSKEQFSFRNKHDKNSYKVDKKGHVLISFRGEKISGSLDFISKIMEFEHIASVRNFIDRIEDCNKKIQPILLNEMVIMTEELEGLSSEKKSLEPKYQELKQENNIYSTKKTDLKNILIAKGELDPLAIDAVKLNRLFNSTYKEYAEFEKEFNKVSTSYNILVQKINNLKSIFEKITKYERIIADHFSVKLPV